MNKFKTFEITLAVLAVALIGMFVTLPAHAQTVGLHIGSHHFPQTGQNNANPGIYVMTEDLWTAGIYKNSGRKTTVYAGKGYHLGPIDIGAALATGYKRECNENGCWGFSRWAITPVVTLSYAAPAILGVSPRVWFSPPVGNASAVVHVSLETKWK
jgi:hypothetical protein